MFSNLQTLLTLMSIMNNNTHTNEDFSKNTLTQFNFKRVFGPSFAKSIQHWWNQFPCAEFEHQWPQYRSNGFYSLLSKMFCTDSRLDTVTEILKDILGFDKQLAEYVYYLENKVLDNAKFSKSNNHILGELEEKHNMRLLNLENYMQMRIKYNISSFPYDTIDYFSKAMSRDSYFNTTHFNDTMHKLIEAISFKNVTINKDKDDPLFTVLNKIFGLIPFNDTSYYFVNKYGGFFDGLFVPFKWMILDVVEPVIKILLGFVGDFINAILEVIKGLIPEIDKVIEFLVNLFDRILVLIVSVFKPLEKAFFLSEYILVFALVNRYVPSSIPSVCLLFIIMLIGGIKRKFPSLVLLLLNKDFQPDDFSLSSA